MNRNTNHSSNSKSPETWQSSRGRSHLKEGSVRHSPSEINAAEILLSLSQGGPSNNTGRRRSVSATHYARYRQINADLMTKHMFTGKKVGKRLKYVPVYKRNRHGKLFKLKEIRAKCWKYVELNKLSEEEVEGDLKMMEEPENDVVL